MKRTTFLPVLLVLSLPASAEETRPPADPQQTKAQVVEHIDARIRILQEVRACVEKATDIAAITLCHEEERKKSRALRQQGREALREGKPAPR
ncbi:MAG: hypothetical protein FJY34_12440 [Betaproteobacteria bacterium]|nr:hypothetical protein [Betaproteobacteria bacterium]